MSSSDQLLEMYDNYYTNGGVAQKRAIAARQSVRHIHAVSGNRKFASLIDIGAGEGAVLQELDSFGYASEMAAVEISTSGLEAIQRRNIASLHHIDAFDGYKIPHVDKSFDLGLAIHVLEHVEHERMFLLEAKRACKNLYIEVPLELTRNLDRSIRLSGPYGHINFYTPGSFKNLLKTCGLKVDKMMVFPHDLEYEQHLAGKQKGWIKYQIRHGLLKVAPKFAVRNMVYMAGALCSADQ